MLPPKLPLANTLSALGTAKTQRVTVAVHSEVGSHSVRGVVVLAEGVAARRKREEKRYFAKRHGLVLVVEMVCTRSRNARSAVQA